VSGRTSVNAKSPEKHDAVLPRARARRHPEGAIQRPFPLLTGGPQLAKSSTEFFRDRLKEPPDVAKPDLGTKRLCAGCGAKFYDLNRTPIVCPKCETVFVVPVVTSRARPEAKPVPVAAPVAE